VRSSPCRSAPADDNVTTTTDHSRAQVNERQRCAEHVCGRFDCHRGFHHRRVSHAQRVQPTSEAVLLLQGQTVPQQSAQIRTPTR